MCMQVPCATPAFLLQWLSQPQEDLSQHLLFQTQLTGKLAAVAAARREIQPAASLQDELTDLA